MVKYDIFYSAITNGVFAPMLSHAQTVSLVPTSICSGDAEYPKKLLKLYLGDDT